MTGPGREPDKIYVSQEVDRALAAAEGLADRMKDEYVSVEHLMLALLDQPNTALKRLFDRYQIRRDAFLAALMEVAGQHPCHLRQPGGHL